MKPMTNQLIKDLMADTSNKKIGQRLHAVAHTFLSIAAYAYTAGLILGESWSALVQWHEQHWIGSTGEPESSLGASLTGLNNTLGVELPKQSVDASQPIAEELNQTVLKPKAKQRRAIGFAN